MAFRLEREGAEPLYRQIRKAVEEQIARNTFDFDRPLPSTRGLAVQLGVSRNTVNLAYQELMAEGFILSRPRSGLFVNEELRHDWRQSRHGRPPTGGPSWSTHLARRADAALPKVEKVKDWHRYTYVFIAGQFDARSFPARAWARALREALNEPHLHFSLRDAIEEDDPLLLEMLCREILPARGIDADVAEVLVTMGSQEGLSLLSSALLHEGSTVAVEDPGYLDARHIFVRAGAALRALPVDGSGIVPAADLIGVDLLHLTPSHHHPTNVTLSIGRRQQLLAQASASDTVIVEDDYDSELRYQGSPSPALKGLDEQGRVVYLGTFSKFLAPGLRLGYVVADRELIGQLRDERRYRIRHPPGHLQRAMALFLASGQYQRAVRQHRSNLRGKWEVMCEAIDRELRWDIPFPPGGVSIWVEGPEDLDGPSLTHALLREGVIVERGDIFFADPSRHRNCLRLGFAAARLETIDPGIKIIARAAQRQLRRTSPRSSTSSASAAGSPGR
jgi:GntR family transcriptional regulator/MocR family aminotransferase